MAKTVADQFADVLAIAGVKRIYGIVGELLALMRKGGVDSHLAFDLLTNSLFDSGVHKTYGAEIVGGNYSPPGLTAPLAVKDLRLALSEAEHTAVPMPAASLVHGRLVAMVARGWAELDWSARLARGRRRGFERRSLNTAQSPAWNNCLAM